MRRIRLSRARSLALRLAAVTAACVAVAVVLAEQAAAAPATVAAAAPAPAVPAPAPRLSARAAELIVAGSGQELYGYGENRELAIASTTKLMTALLTLERVPLQTVFAQNGFSLAAGDSQIGLVPGQRMTVHDLLLAMLLPSADDAAEDLAYNVGGGSVDRFVSMMNVRAAQLGLTHTHYSTPVGLDTPGNYSSAADLVKLASFLLAHQPFFAQAVALPTAGLATGPMRQVTNRNDLVGRVRWITGVKTGHTLQAGYVLVGSGTRDGMSLISVVLGTPTEGARDADTLALLNYGFANFRPVTPVVAGQTLARPAVRDQSSLHPQLLAASTFTRVLPRGAPVRIRVDAPRELAGPLPRNAVVGSVIVLDGNQPIARIPLLLARPIPAVSSFTLAVRFLLRATTLLALILVLGGVVAAAVFRRQRSRARAAAASR